MYYVRFQCVFNANSNYDKYAVGSVTTLRHRHEDLPTRKSDIYRGRIKVNNCILYHENRLLAVDFHELSYLFFSTIRKGVAKFVV